MTPVQFPTTVGSEAGRWCPDGRGFGTHCHSSTHWYSVPRARTRATKSPVLGKKPVIAIDCDEVLAQFVPALARYHNQAHGTNLTVHDFHSYKFCEVWGGTNEAATEKVHDFFATAHFLEHMEPIPGAYQALNDLKERFSFVVVTSRQHIIREATLAWLDQHFPQIFDDVLFGNHWTRDAPDPTLMTASKRTKSEMCASVGAVAIVDDALGYAKECSSCVQRVVLFGDYGWNRAADSLPSNVARASCWVKAKQLLQDL